LLKYVPAILMLKSVPAILSTSIYIVMVIYPRCKSPTIYRSPQKTKSPNSAYTIELFF